VRRCGGGDEVGRPLNRRRVAGGEGAECKTAQWATERARNGDYKHGRYTKRVAATRSGYAKLLICSAT
jgi:hypothetical protein